MAVVIRITAKPMTTNIAWRWSYPARVMFPAIAERTMAIEKMLKTHGWENPKLMRIIAEIDIKQYTQVPWPTIKIPPDYTLFNWEALTSEDETQIEQMFDDREVPAEFNPYQHDDKIFLPASFGLRKNNDLIGWNIVYSLDENTKEYNNLFLKKDFRGLGHAIALLHRSFGEQYKLNIPKAKWLINADNKPVLKIAQKIAGGYTDKITEVRISQKIL